MCAYCVIVTGIRTWWAKKTDLLFEVCNFFTVTTWKSISVACYCVSVEGQNQSDQAVPGVLLPNQRRTTSRLKNQFRGSSILRLALSIRCALLLLNTVGVLISLWACMCICCLVCDTWQVWCQTYCHFPNHRASSLFDQYQNRTEWLFCCI